LGIDCGLDRSIGTGIPYIFIGFQGPKKVFFITISDCAGALENFDAKWSRNLQTTDEFDSTWAFESPYLDKFLAGPKSKKEKKQDQNSSHGWNRKY